MRELVGGELAHQHRAGQLHPRLDRGILRGHVVLQDLRLSRGTYAGSRDHVLEAIRHPGQARRERARLTAHPEPLCLACAPERNLRGLRDEAVQAGLEAGDPFELMLQHLYR
ncbi:MAG: hypothetical protein NTW37_19645 [Proteobacteria bacterium]|nr:hypothetical protein [Pseudomonadota bacterium]